MYSYCVLMLLYEIMHFRLFSPGKVRLASSRVCMRANARRDPTRLQGYNARNIMRARAEALEATLLLYNVNS